jgi:hypothetical protein
MNPIRGRAALAALVSATLLAGCNDGTNPFRPVPPGGGGGGGGTTETDSVPPVVEILIPNAETPTVAVGSDIFVRARVRDAVRLAQVTFEGYAVRGDPDLGTAVRVDRFETKTVDLLAGGRVVRDTTLDRFLVATGDTLPESGVFVVVTATDSAGKVAADTFQVNLGGPRVELGEPTPASPYAGSQVSVRLVARDARDLLTSARVEGSGSFTPTPVVLQFNPARAEIDTVVTIPVPQGASTSTPLRLVASATSGSNQTATSLPVEVTIQPAQLDQTAPRVTLLQAIPARAEHADSFAVQVSATDETRVDSVGVTVVAVRRLAGGGEDTLHVYRGAGAVAGGTFRFGYPALGLAADDTASVDLRVTAWAKDPAGNCATATTPATPQQLPCAAGPQGSRVSVGGGALTVVFLARGLTLARPNGSDVIADLAADDHYLYLSNFTRNRVELLPLGGLAYGTPVRVGSQPWGLALGRTRDSLYVANSGGTNISVIPLGGAVLAEAEGRRITPPNERLFSVDFNSTTGVTSQVTMFDYSDRPQFLAQASNGLLAYSTRPTAAATDGTVRIWDPRKTRSDIFIGYVDRSTAGKAIAVNADSAFLVPPGQLLVCPRRRVGDASDPECILGSVGSVADSLRAMRAQPANASGGRYDTRLDIGADIEDVGFSDTTFVAASTDRRYIAIGEGIRTNARIPLFEAVGDSLVLRGNVRDLISNTAERVIGLGLNRDGSLGAARGGITYLFNDRLRLQGTVENGTPTGGVAVHPDNASYPTGPLRLAFVSGSVDGRPYIDVVDTFNFFRLHRIFTRDPVVGALVVAPRAPGDPAGVNLRLYALTTTGVLGLTIHDRDLVP